MKSKRFVAFIIDMAIAVILAIFVYVTLRCFNINSFSFIGAPFAWVLLICKDCFNGMSVGKRFVGIQIIDSTNREIASPAKCVIRNLFASSISGTDGSKRNRRDGISSSTMWIYGEMSIRAANLNWI